MTYVVGLRYIDGDLAELMRAIRAWLGAGRRDAGGRRA